MTADISVVPSARIHFVHFQIQSSHKLKCSRMESFLDKLQLKQTKKRLETHFRFTSLLNCIMQKKRSATVSNVHYYSALKCYVIRVMFVKLIEKPVKGLHCLISYLSFSSFMLWTKRRMLGKHLIEMHVFNLFMVPVGQIYSNRYPYFSDVLIMQFLVIVQELYFSGILPMGN